MIKNELLGEMRLLLIQHLEHHCLSHELDFDRGRGSFYLVNGSKIHIRFNNHGQYSYVIQFSSRKLDRMRFDNYDEFWEVKSKPHHLHLRNSEDVSEATTNGNPKDDISIILEVLKRETKLFHVSS